jgi:hypothetical protein
MATALPPSPSSSAGVDIGRTFRFVFDDPEWVKKVLIGGAFTLASSFIIGIFFVAGYWVRLIRNVAAGSARPLPEWDDLGAIFSDGLTAVGVAFVHVFGVVVIVGGIGCAGGMVLFGLGGMAGHGRAEDAAGALAGMGMMGLYFVFLILMLAMNLYLPSALVRVALKGGDFATGFDWRANVAFIRDNLSNYLLSIVFYLVANFASQFGMLLCCVGIFPMMFWAYMVLGYGLGETARLSRRPV